MTTYQKILVSVFAILLVWSAINPVSYTEWALETTPVLLGIIAVFFVGRRYKLSNFSYTLLTIYFCLALLPGHYNVSKVPFGDVLGELVGSERNMYDRLLHFSLGFLCLSTFYEVCYQLITKKDTWKYVIPFGAVLAFSSLYEIAEWIAHLFVSPAASITFIGAQGDLWDPAIDMTIAAGGALIAIGILLVINHRKDYMKNS
jgi:putative membrane protein